MTRTLTDDEPGETKVRHIRIPTKLWRDAARKAKRKNVKLAQVVRDLLQAWVDEPDDLAA